MGQGFSEYKNIVNSFVRLWNFTRSETLDILSVLNDEQLNFKPEGEKFQPLLYQFGCIIRTQLVYAKAIEEGKIDFSWFHETNLPGKTSYKNKEELMKAIKSADSKWSNAIKKYRRDQNHLILWPGFKMLLVNHITSLIAHERIHHGQLITYFTLAGYDLPQKFKTNWAL